MQVALVFNRNPTFSFVEFTAPLPVSQSLWLASTADEWKQLMQPSVEIRPLQLSLRDVLLSSTLLTNKNANIDATKASSIWLYGLAGQIFDYRKQDVLVNTASSHRTTGFQLGMRAQQQNIHEALTTFQGIGTATPPELLLLREFLAMSLFVSVDDILRFAGRNGLAEARHTFPLLESWFIQPQARNAVWHAGQVVRTAGQILPFQFRGYEAIMIYHAVLVLWIYGVLRCASLKHSTKSRCVSPEADWIESAREKQILLNGDANSDTMQFLELGLGCPGLANVGSLPADSPFCDLRYPSLILAIGSAVLKNNYRNTQHDTRIPPSVKRLCDLMDRLGAVPQVEI